MPCNFCPVCRVPVGTNREHNVDRLAERLRSANALRKGGEALLFTTTPWERADDAERDTWRDIALTAIAALDVR